MVKVNMEHYTPIQAIFYYIYYSFIIYLLFGKPVVGDFYRLKKLKSIYRFLSIDFDLYRFIDFKYIYKSTESLTD